jgi:hypothetical protein
VPWVCAKNAIDENTASVPMIINMIMDTKRIWSLPYFGTSSSSSVVPNIDPILLFGVV